MSFFLPPGNVQDFSDDLKQVWSDSVNKLIDDAISYNPSERTNYGPRPGFFNAHKEGVNQNDLKPFVKIEWNAFPKTLTTMFGYTSFEDKYSHSDMRVRTEYDDQNRVIGIYQDEYLEWNSVKDSDGDISEIYFTCENPEYWGFYFDNDKQGALAKYSEIVGSQVDENILFPNGGQYDSQNQYNLDFCVHLCQPNNSLEAELDIAACSTILRKKKEGGVITNPDDLIKCAKYGNVGRNSDPHIGDVVNGVARRGHTKISIPNPIGLYMEYLPNENIDMPDDTDPADLFTPIRFGEYDGTKFIVRGKISVPKGKTWKLKDIVLNNQPFKYAGQFVDFFNIFLQGMAKEYPDYNPVPLSCVQRVQKSLFAFAKMGEVKHKTARN